MSGEPENLKNCENSLKNWESWLEKWNKVQETISQKLNVNTGSLVMNYSEGLRSIKQEQEILEYSEITTHFDKYRGKPDFYKLPEALPKKLKCNCSKPCRCHCSMEPTYFRVRTKPEQYIVPEVHFVKTPDFIQDEKNILIGTRNIYKRWQNSKYRQEKMEKSREKIMNIVPHWPKCEHLIILGKKIDHKEDVEDAEKIVREISKHKEESLQSQKSVEDIKAILKPSKPSNVPEVVVPRLSLRIKNVDLDKWPKDTNVRQIRLFFDYDISLGKTSSQIIHLENNGRSVLRLSWKKLQKFRLFGFSPDKCEKYGFCFDRKEMLILPGQIIAFPVFFKTDHPGNYSEHWEITSSPRLWYDEQQVILVLESYSYFGDLKKKVDAILMNMHEFGRNLIIEDVLRDLIDQTRYVETPVIPCIYGESVHFELANLANGQPLFLFNKEVFEELCQIYNKFKVEDKAWDLSIATLEKLAHFKDTVKFLDNKAEELNQKILQIGSAKEVPLEIKKSTTKADKNVGKGKAKKGKSATKIKSTSKDIIDNEPKKEIVKEIFEYSHQEELRNSLRKLESPTVINKERDKHVACCSVMIACFNKMDHYLQKLESDMNISRNVKYPSTNDELIPLNQLPDRFVFEYFDGPHMPKQSFEEKYRFEQKKKPRHLRYLSIDDIETLYTTYFNKPIELVTKKPDKKQEGKGKKGKKDKSPKKDKKEKKAKASSKDKSKTHDKLLQEKESVECFDPYSESFTFIPALTESESLSSIDEIDKVSKKVYEEFKYNEYLIIYSCLGNAVDALVDTLQTFESVVPHSTLKEVEDHWSEVPEDAKIKTVKKVKKTPTKNK